MNKELFEQWLLEQGSTNTRLRKDTVSRAKRVERAFQELDPGFSYEREYKKDHGVSFMNLISRRGAAIDKPVKLPIGSNQMDSIVSATKKYFRFLDGQN